MPRAAGYLLWEELGHRYQGVFCRSGNRDALPWALHTPHSNRQQPYPPHGREHRDHKGKGLQKRRPVEGADPGWCRVRPPLSDACPSEGFCQDTALWNLKQPEQAEADPHMQEPDRLP